MAPEEAVHGRGRETLAMLRLEPLRDFRERDVNGRLDITKIAGPSASIRSDRLSPPCARGATEPVSRHRRCHFTAIEGAMPNRAAAARQLWPAVIAPTTRCLRSKERGRVMKAGLLTSLNRESQPRPNGNPAQRFREYERCSSLRRRGKPLEPTREV